jgi:hypothetical protein
MKRRRLTRSQVQAELTLICNAMLERGEIVDENGARGLTDVAALRATMRDILFEEIKPGVWCWREAA